MKWQRVRMVLEFEVPVGREHYGHRMTEAEWTGFVKHSMRQWIKDSEDVMDVYRWCAHLRQDPSFEWLEECDRSGAWDPDPRWK